MVNEQLKLSPLIEAPPENGAEIEMEGGEGLGVTHVLRTTGLLGLPN
jgi:hypothetical protein